MKTPPVWPAGTLAGIESLNFSAKVSCEDAKTVITGFSSIDLIATPSPPHRNCEVHNFHEINDFDGETTETVKSSGSGNEARSTHPRTLLHRDVHLLHDLQPEAFQRRDMHGRIRQQPDPLDAQVGKNLPPQPDGPQDAPRAVLRALALAQLLVQNDAPDMGFPRRPGRNRAAR